MAIEEDDGVEIFLPDSAAESNKPLILPSRSGVNLTAAQRRWRLLKNIKVASKRSTSLTQREEELLVALNKPNPDTTDTTSTRTSTNTTITRADHHQPFGKEDEALQKARKELLERIHSKGHKLTAQEEKFLTYLAKCPNVTADYLIRSSQVLLHDPLYKLDEADCEPEVANKVKPALRQRGASFRSEVWTHFSSSTLLNKNSITSSHVETKDEKKKGFMYKFFLQSRQTIEKKEENERIDLSLEDPVEFSILATSVEDRDCQPHVLSPPIMDALRIHLPFAVQQDNFWLRYSMVRDGASMRTLLRKVRSSARTVIAIETMEGDVFGAFTSSPWRANGHGFYGSCEAFMWRMSKSRYTPCETVEDQISLEHNLDIFSWSGKNRNVQSLVNAEDELVIGGGAPDDDPSKDGGCALTIRLDSMNGFSDPCFTFACPPLPIESSGDSFEIANLEMWALTPVDNLPQAEKLELGRQFIFDHGNFAKE